MIKSKNETTVKCTIGSAIGRHLSMDVLEENLADVVNSEVNGSHPTTMGRMAHDGSIYIAGNYHSVM